MPPNHHASPPYRYITKLSILLYHQALHIAISPSTLSHYILVFGVCTDVVSLLCLHINIILWFHCDESILICSASLHPISLWNLYCGPRPRDETKHHSQIEFEYPVSTTISCLQFWFLCSMQVFTYCKPSKTRDTEGLKTKLLKL